MVDECQTRHLCANTGCVFCLQSRGQVLLGEKSNQALKRCSVNVYPVRGDPQGLVVSALERQGCLSSFGVPGKFG